MLRKTNGPIKVHKSGEMRRRKIVKSNLQWTKYFEVLKKQKKRMQRVKYTCYETKYNLFYYNCTRNCCTVFC